MIHVLLEKLEHPRTGEIVVSASKAQKIKGWDTIVSTMKEMSQLTVSLNSV